MTADVQRELAEAMSRLSGYPVGSRTVQVFVAVAQDYADALIAAAEKRATADAGLDLSTVSTYRLAEMWVHDELTADEFFAEIDRRAPLMVEAEIREAQRRRTDRGSDGV